MQAESPPLVSAEHLRTAAAKAAPSLPAGERDRLERIYRRFQGSRSPGNLPATPGAADAAKGKGKRATLA